MKYRPEIDGLRAIAVLPVLFFHAHFPFFSGGFLGVDVFFVISGFLITSIILQGLREGTFTFWQFYGRRIRRILPALYLVLLTTLPLAWLWLSPKDYSSFSGSLISVVLFFSNVFFWRDSGYFDGPGDLKPLLHSWSLSLEEQYYFVIPFLLWILWRKSSRRLGIVLFALTLSSLFLSIFITDKWPTMSFFLLPTRAWELLVGALLAYYQAQISGFFKRKAKDLICTFGFFALAISIVTFDQHTAHPGILTLIPIFGTSVLIGLTSRDTVWGKILAFPGLVKVGLISYSLYLWHQPAFVFGRILKGSELMWQEYSLLMIFSLALAYLSWKFVETPLRDRTFAPGNRLYPSLFILSLAFLGLGFYGKKSGGAPHRLSTAQLNILKYEEGYKLRECHDLDPDQACILGERQESPTIALLGDSHMGMLASGFDHLFKSIEVSAVSFSQSSCPYVPGFKLGGRPDIPCFERNEKISERIASLNISTVILSARYVLYVEKQPFDNMEGGREPGPPWWLEPEGREVHEKDLKPLLLRAYQKSVQDLLTVGKRVILIYPVPEVGWSVPGRLTSLSMIDPDAVISTSYDLYKTRSKAVIDAFDQLGSVPNLHRIYPADYLCDKFVPGRCVANDGPKVFYIDDNHLTDIASEWITKEVEAIITPAKANH